MGRFLRPTRDPSTLPRIPRQRSAAFTIHGTSRTETVALQLSLTSTTLQAVGALTFPWDDFGMTAPSVGGFVNVAEIATMEFDLRLKPS